MSETKGIRPGGRSARVQAAVHQAVRDIQSSAGREELTVPAIAARAGVTPSTIYRRWGDLAQLLSDVALEHLRPDTIVPDTGTFRGDVETWLVSYVDEMSTDFGRTMLRDLINDGSAQNPGECACALKEKFEEMRKKALARGECPPTSDEVMDHVYAPLLYRLLFTTGPVSLKTARQLLDDVIARAAPGGGSKAPARTCP